MDINQEVWKDVPGYEGTYRASNRGNIQSVPRRCVCRSGTVRKLKGGPIRQRNHPMGYLMVSLCKEGVYRHLLVHRVVASTFLGNPPAGFEVCHKDGDKRNNELSNLRWDTRESNCRDRLLHGVSRKLTQSQVEWVKKTYFAGGTSQQKLADAIGVSQVMVSQIVRGKQWRI